MDDNENELKRQARGASCFFTCWPLIPSSLALKASAWVMRKSLPSPMQIQEMNSKVNGVFVPMIKSCASFFMTPLILAIKQRCVERRREKKEVFIISSNNYPKIPRELIMSVLVVGTFDGGAFNVRG